MKFDAAAFMMNLEQKRQSLEPWLAAYMPERGTCPPLIHEAMHYAVMNGGKRIRPLMLMEAAALGGLEPYRTVRAACALEYVHCYSLVHDDLPAMDNDDLRRGKPTCHIVYGEDIAILTGDALLTLAFEMLAACAGMEGFEPAAITRAIAIMARAAGSQGMIGGQVLDLQYEHCTVEKEQLDGMHMLKTGRLFTAALAIGATLAGMEEERLERLRQYAVNFGMAFQISDDILDVCGSESTLGKPVGSDIRNEKTTYTSLFGIEQARRMALEHVERCLESLKEFGAEAGFLRQLALFTVERQS